MINQFTPGTKVIWRNAGADIPGTITALLGEANGERYYSFQQFDGFSSPGGVPESQIIIDALEFTLDDLAELNPDLTPTASTLEADTQRFYKIIWSGGPYGMVQNLNAGPDFDKRRSIFIPTSEPFKTPDTWKNNHSNIFHCINPTIIRREYYQAVRNGDIAALNQVFREYDAKDFTDPSEAEVRACLPIVKARDEKRVAEAFALDPNSKVRPASAQALHNQAQDMAEDLKFKANPEPYMQMVRDHVDALMPAPSIVVKSGGGYQVYWLLTETLIIRTHPDDHAAHVQSYAEDLQRRWVRLDPRADQGVNDIRRILRVPGSYNHKKKYAPNYPKVTFYQKRFDLRYKLSGLAQIMPAQVAIEAPKRAQERPVAGESVDGAPYEGESVIAAYNAKYRLADLLTQHGYTYAGSNRYTRPGGQTTAGVELFPNENNARIWSTNDPLYSGEHRCTPFTVFCVYEHDGKVKKAVAAAAVELGMVRSKAESIKTTIEKARIWLQTADLAALIPADLQSVKGYRTNATDKRLYSGLLDILRTYRALSGPISIQQLSLETGLSEGSVRNAMKRLIGACLVAKIDPPDLDNDSGCFWYKLVSLDYIISCVDCAVLAVSTDTPYRAKYATKTFTTLKADDAFQRGGSKRQRQQATIKAIGPDALLAADVLADYGTLTQTALGAYTHQSKYTVSRIVKRLESLDIITVKAEGTRRFVTLNADWLDTVKELTPQMPTYGMKFKREMSAAARTVDYCDKLIAKGKGDLKRIRQRRERSAWALESMVWCELSQNYKQDDAKQIFKTLEEHNKQKAAAAESVTKLSKIPAALDFINFMRSEPQKPWFDAYDKGRLARMAQTLDDNQTLIDARLAMLHEDLTPASVVEKTPDYSQAFLFSGIASYSEAMQRFDVLCQQMPVAMGKDANGYYLRAR